MTVDTLRRIIIDEARATIDTTIQKNDPDNIVGHFLDEVRASVSLVTSDGYDERARKYSCHAKLKMFAENRGIERDASYTSQATEDSDGLGVTSLDHGTVEAMAAPIGAAAREEWTQRRYAGQWAGNYSCQGLDGSTDGLKGPFSQHVYMQVSALEGKLERTTKGGGIEKLHVVFYTSGEANVDGDGENTPDDRWIAHFLGHVSGHRLVVDGGLSDSDGTRLLRKCSIQLTMQTPSASKAEEPH